ncbi:DegT/DnrJ/EryC1/StrS family aminotransferase [Kibdelosporangium lantanae]|uniref:DegT/DnrJ/EryC1/StrS family aminotransferase n=1 Tax=Kibdelosporangium lantanae TaxID=1497396 RepID=A0ABW3M1V4_9PSEU
MHDEEALAERIDTEIKDNLGALVDNKQWNVYRDGFVSQVERALSDLLGASALTTSSGTSALELALRTVGVGPGQDVIVPNSTFVATVQAVLLVGARPVLCDVDDMTYNPTPADIARVRTDCTTAVMFVHTFGNSSGVDGVADYCRAQGLYLVEDAAQAIGARIGERSVGSFGDCAAFSFNTSKPVSCGDGGAFASRNADLFATAKAIRHAGLRETPDGRYLAFEVGGKSVMTQWQAAVLAPQLAAFGELYEIREQTALALRDRLASYGQLQDIDTGVVSAWQRVAITTKDLAQADELLRANDWIERFYAAAVVDEPVVAARALIDPDVAERGRNLWERMVGVTLWPFTSFAELVRRASEV